MPLISTAFLYLKIPPASLAKRGTFFRENQQAVKFYEQNATNQYA